MFDFLLNSRVIIEFRMIFVIAALGHYLPLSINMLDVAIAGYMGIGAYTSAVLTRNFGTPFSARYLRFDRLDMVKRFLTSGRSGFYLAVTREGEVAAGDAVTWIARDDHAISVADVVDLYRADAANQDLLRRASELPALPEGWRDYFRKRL